MNHPSRRRRSSTDAALARFACLVALVLLIATAARSEADVVQTPTERLEGTVAFLAPPGDSPGAIALDGRRVPLGDVLYVVVGEPPLRLLPAPNTVRLANGEVWFGQIIGLRGTTLQVWGTWFGGQEMDTGPVAALDFNPRAGLPATALAPGESPWAKGLVREGGPPIPGTLLWIDEARIAIDSPVGVLALPREGAVRYGFPNPSQAPEAGADELGLVDGSIFRGQLKSAGETVVLKHAILGTLSVTTEGVRYIVRHPAGTAYLAEQQPKAVEALGVAGTALPPVVLCAGETSLPSTGRKTPFAKALRIEPKTTVRYAVPRGNGEKVLIATVFPVEGARGDVQFRILVGGKTVFEHTLAPADAAIPVSVPLGGKEDLAIEVDFGERIGFPSGVIVADPVVVRGRSTPPLETSVRQAVDGSARIAAAD